MAQVAMFITLVAQDGQRDALVVHLQAAARAAEDEPGTVLWTVQVAPTNTQTVYLYEVFADEAARQVHEQAPGYAEGMQQTQALLATPPEVIPILAVGGKGLV